MTRLFLENIEVELGENFNAPLTKTFENLDNPTQIINDYSKTVTIPHTQKNDRLFGFLFNPDRLTATDGTTLTGIFFNPYQKIAFRLEYNDYVLMIGYLKVLTVSSEGYECSLNSELGSVLQEMQKITFDETKYEGDEKTKYWIDGSTYVNTKITKDLVVSSWNSTQTSTKLRKIGEQGYRITDIIGYTPNNSFNKNFDYKTFQDSEGAKGYADYLKGKTWDGQSFESLTGLTPDAVVENGLTPRAVGEFRSYLQQPFIYWNQLFQIFQEKVENITGYKFDLDINWFNINNPYWSKTVLTLLNFDQIQKKIEEKTNIYFCNLQYNGGSLSSNGNETILDTSSNAPYFVDDAQGGYFEAIGNKTLKMSVSGFSIPYRFGAIEKSVKACLATGNFLYLGAKTKACHLYTDLVIISLDGTRELKLLQRTISYNVDTKYPPSVDEDAYITKLIPLQYTDFRKIITSTKTYWEGLSTFETFKTVIQDIYEPFRFMIKIYYKFVSTDPEAKTHPRYDVVVEDPTTNTYSDDYSTITIGASIVGRQLELKNISYRTNSIFTLNTLWNNEYSIYDMILNYCKQFRILISIDDLKKKIKFRKASTFFSNYNIVDFSKKIDKTKDYIISPLTFNNKYILFNYEENKSQLNTIYKNNNNLNFGEKQLTTNYQFNNETKKLFSKINNGICSTYSDFRWAALVGLPQETDSVMPNVSYFAPAEIFVNCSDKDNNQIDSFGWLFFVRSANFDSTIDGYNIFVSDDTPEQIYSETYFYSNNRTRTTKYLQLNDVYDSNCVLFNIPNENYTYLNTHYENVKGIYNNFWDNYIKERYNTQNKIVTCYLKLSPIDYANFEFNKFLLIDNQLYIVNKIYDYDITSTGSTKVDLITIQNIDGYTK